jgi:excisionase family DNA binding protein
VQEVIVVQPILHIEIDGKPVQSLAPVPEFSATLLSTEAAAERLSISPETLRRMCRRKAITFIAVTPHEYRFAHADLDEYVASRRNKRKSAVK